MSADAAMPVTIAQPPRSASLVRGNFVYKFGSTPIVQAQAFIIAISKTIINSSHNHNYLQQRGLMLRMVRSSASGASAFWFGLLPV